MIFCSHAAIWLLSFTVFSLFYCFYFLQINSLCILGLIFLFSQWKFLELLVRTCLAMFFYFVVNIFFTTIWRHNQLKPAFWFIRSCNLNWSACVTSFLTLWETEHKMVFEQQFAFLLVFFVRTRNFDIDFLCSQFFLICFFSKWLSNSFIFRSGSSFF